MIDQLIAALAEAQHGVVAVWQLLELGLGRGAIEYRVSIGRLHRVHQGVFAVGHAKLTREGHRMAAVLAYGPDAVLSHRSAAAHWGIGHASYRHDVTTPQSKRCRKTIRAHTAKLHAEDRTVHNGIPTTSLARTILDLAAQSHQRPTDLPHRGGRPQAPPRSRRARPRHRPPPARRRRRPPEGSAQNVPRPRRHPVEARTQIPRADRPRQPPRAAVQRRHRGPYRRRLLAAVEARGGDRQRRLPQQPARVRDRPHPRRHASENRSPRPPRHRATASTTTEQPCSPTSWP